ncbi:MAG: hypothetical protein ACLFRU_02905 [Paracoccaceae bacterium]
MSLNETSSRPPLPLRILLSLPVIGWIARDLLYGSSDNIYYLLVILATLLILAVATWGLPALSMAALAAVPVIWIVLLLITVGK